MVEGKKNIKNNNKQMGGNSKQHGHGNRYYKIQINEKDQNLKC